MRRTVSADWREECARFVEEKLGLYFPENRLQDLERGFGKVCRELGFEDATECFQRLTSTSLTKQQIEILASHLTVGETYFFREKQTFEFLEEHVLPEILNSRRESNQRLRIWSAGCCTGEEPYSIAVLLHRLIPDLTRWNITILATDINPLFLRKAESGVYGEWSFRESPQWLKEKYFLKAKDGRFELLPQIKERVTFSYLNLSEDVYPSLLNNTNAMDLIFCRNVLMYFHPERAENVARRFYRALVEGGWLIVSRGELSHVLFPEFEAVNFSGGILYRKNSTKTQRAPMVFPEISREPEPSVDVPIGSIHPDSQIWLAQEKEYEEAPAPAAENQDEQEPQAVSYEEALALYVKGSYVEAENVLLSLLSRNPAGAQTLSLMARVCANQGKLEEALIWCEKAIAQDRLASNVYYLKASILQEQNRMQEAEASLKHAVYMDPDFVLAYFALANVSQRQEKFKESAKQLENVLSLLKKWKPQDILPESEGLPAGRLMEVVRRRMSAMTGEL